MREKGYVSLLSTRRLCLSELRSCQGDRKGTPVQYPRVLYGRTLAVALEVMRVPWKLCACPGSHARALEVMRFPSRNTGAPLLDAWKPCACPGSHSLAL